MKTIDPRLLSSTYMLHMMTGGLSNVNLIDYLKGCKDLVNAQALLNAQACMHIKQHARLFDVLDPAFHQSNISLTERVSPG